MTKTVSELVFFFIRPYISSTIRYFNTFDITFFPFLNFKTLFTHELMKAFYVTVQYLFFQDIKTESIVVNNFKAFFFKDIR